jgi:hypothetical protein
VVLAKAEAGTVDAQEARAASLEHLQAAPATDAEFGHAANPGGLAVNLGNVSPFTAAKQFQRKEKIRVHCVLPLQRFFTNREGLVETESQSTLAARGSLSRGGTGILPLPSERD